MFIFYCIFFVKVLFIIHLVKYVGVKNLYKVIEYFNEKGSENMNKFANFICKHRILVLIVSIVLLIISFISMNLTKINYDILVYLPSDIETIKGQNILTDDFNMGSYSIAVIDNMSSKDILSLEDKIKKVKGVNEVASLYDVIGTSIPLEMLPTDIIEKVHAHDSDLLFITFDNSTSNEETLSAVSKIRDITGESVGQGGMSSMVVDTMNLSEKEIHIYILIAIILCIIILELSLDSYIVPFLLLLNIGFAIIFNLGTNLFLGQISYITKALVAVLQLGVTTDFSIFLYHSYENKKQKVKEKEVAMADAIKETFTSVMGSSLTTIVGFLVLCFMQLTLGRDLGIVMAKGVLLGVICVLTLFPSLLLTFDNLITKTKHKKISPDFTKLNKFIIKHRILALVIFVLLLVPTYLAYTKVEVYYKLDKSLPNTLESIKTNEKLKDDYNIISPEIILINNEIKNDDILNMTSKIESLDGIEWVLSLSKLQNLGISENIIPDDIIKLIKNNKYQMILVNSSYETATNELNSQIEDINKIIKEYDKNAILAGEGPLMKDLVNICDIDFKNVNTFSILCIFIILFFVLKSFSLPFLLIITIETAIFINMSISYFSGTTLPFIAPIVLGTIQLGATIDYAILLTTTYLKNRKKNISKNKAMLETMNYCGISILTSGMCFFASTFGVGIYSKIEMIASLCTLISRGAIISMLVVIILLPSILLTFDKLIMKTTLKERKDKKMKIDNKKLKLSLYIILALLCFPYNIFALTKNETVYTKLNEDGSVKSILVNEQVVNNSKLGSITDNTTLENILNVNNDNKYTKNNNKIVWDTNGEDIFYEGTTNKSLPILVDITYKLNDKVMNINDMLGKSGKVTITFKYKNNDKHSVKINNKNTTLYTPFVVTMSTVLDSKTSKNISVQNGKVISNGTKSIIVGLSVPGMYENLKINDLKDMNTITLSYETTNFSLPSIYNIIVPKIVESSDLEIFDKLDDVYKQVDTLQENMNKIDESAKKVNDGSTKLKNGLSSSINKLSNDKSDALSKEQINTIKEQTISKVKSTFTDDYEKKIGEDAWNLVKQNLSNGNKNVEKEVESSVQSILVSYLGGSENLTYYAGCVKGNIESCEKLMANGYDVKTVASFQEAVIENLTSLASKTSLIVAEETSKQVAINVSKNASLTTASSVSQTLAPEIANLVKNSSINEITNSLNTLYDGVNELDKGINKLSTGISTFNKSGINKVTNMVNGSVKSTTNKIKQMTKLSDNYISFTSSNLSSDSETKFILVIDSKKLEEETKTVKKEEKKETFIDRVINLFK